MNLRYVYLFFFIALQLPFASWGQTIQLYNLSPGIVCAGAATTVSFSTSGTFAAGNTFRVQLSSNYGSTFTDLPGSFTGSPALVTIPASVEAGSNYIYRIVASDPLIYSERSSSFKVVRPAEAKLTGNSTEGNPVNPYTPVDLRVVITGGAPYTLVTQDNTRFRSQDDYTSVETFRVNPAKTTSYSLASVQNGCGAGTVSGSTTVNINPVGFRLLARANSNPCFGTEWPLDFSTDGPLPANTTFEAELVNTYDNNRSMAVTVRGNTSPLLIVLPASMSESMYANSSYRLRVFSRSVGLSAWWPEGNTFSIRTAPRVALQDVSGVAFGQAVSLPISITGSASGVLTLSDGQQLNLYSGTASFAVRPTQTTSYSLVGYSGDCGDGITYLRRTAQVTVNPGVKVDSLSTSELCVGQSVSVYYTASAGYALPEQVRLRVVDPGKSFQFDGRVSKPGQLVVTIPESTPPVQLTSMQVEDRSTGARLTLLTLPGTLSVKDRPRVMLTNYGSSSNTMQRAGNSTIYGTNLSGGTTTLELSTGQRYTLTGGYFSDNSNYNLSLPVYVTQTTSYSVVSVRNECGAGTLVGPAYTIVVQEPQTQVPGVTITSGLVNSPTPCPGARVPINLVPTGTFGADNQFRLEVSDATGAFSGVPVATTTRAESMTFVWPAQSTNSFRVRVSTTSPVTRSAELTFYPDSYNSAGPSVTTTVQVPTGATVPGAATVAAGYVINAAYTFAGRSPFQYELLDGTKGTTEQYTRTINRMYNPTVTAAYGIRRAFDACGVDVKNNGNVQVTVVPQLLVTGSVGESACAQLPVQVPFVASGTQSANVSYVVQASTNRLSWQTLPTSGQGGSLRVQFPAAMGGNTVYYRVASILDGVVTGGTVRSVRLVTVPNLSLTGPDNQSVVSVEAIYSDYSVSLKLVDATASGASVLLSNGKQVTTATLYDAQGSTYVGSFGSYSIVSAYNQCGYGQGQGIVRVAQRPFLVNARNRRNQFCENSPITATYVVGGDLDNGNKVTGYLYNDKTRARQLIGETTSPVLAVSLATGLPAGDYSVVVVTSAPATTLTTGTSIYVQQPISASIAGRSIAVYVGDNVYIPVVAASGIPFSLTWSNGQQTEHTYYMDGGFSARISASTSYSVVRAQNGCGVANVSGAVSVTALPAEGITLRLLGFNGRYCAGQVIAPFIDELKGGLIKPDNQYTLLMSDDKGQNFQPVSTATTPEALTVLLPTTMPTGDGYTFRVASSSPAHLGSTHGPVIISSPLTAVLTGNATINRGDSTYLNVELTGKSPWRFTITDLFGPRTFYAEQSPFRVAVRPDTTSGYRLTSVYNDQCGQGKVSGTALISVVSLLATEPALALQVRVWPNPTSGQIRLQGELPTHSAVQVRLYSLLGALVQQRTSPVPSGRLSEALDLSGLPAGLYLLSVEQDGRRRQYKLLKQ